MVQAYSSTQGGVKSTISDAQQINSASDDLELTGSATEYGYDNIIDYEQIRDKILMEWNTALLGNTKITHLETECVLIDNEISIGADASDTSFKMSQIITTNINSVKSDQIINGLSYEFIQDMSISLMAVNQNSTYQVSTNFNYLSSSYYNTLLNIGLFYKIDTDPSENLIGEYILGSENSNFTRDLFSKTFFKSLTHSAGDTISFYLKGKIHTDLSNFDYASLDNLYKPKIIFSLLGNIISIMELGS